MTETLSADYEIKRQIVKMACQYARQVDNPAGSTPESIDAAIGRIPDGWYHYADAVEMVRCWGKVTGLPVRATDRRYAGEEVGAVLSSGIAVGWTRWSRQGKDANPEWPAGDPGSVPWIEDAYFLDAKDATHAARNWPPWSCDNKETEAP